MPTRMTSLRGRDGDTRVFLNTHGDSRNKIRRRSVNGSDAWKERCNCHADRHKRYAQSIEASIEELLFTG